ncbi:hypothetical protein E2C01_053603 [Portunus trituberculatus]|uniref:Uncharacterized protein n=1 Tax=Portunus trituberculatus TaxID=210409 RepID=A0A5B7GPN2_PORTR|nr:hypothetical protein [Portunus trituberculatus]
MSGMHAASKTSAPARHHPGTACHQPHPAANLPKQTTCLQQSLVLVMSLPPSRTSSTQYAVGSPLWPQPHLQRAVLSGTKERVHMTCVSIACATQPKKRVNAAGQCATATAPSPRMDTPTKPVKGATRQHRSPSGMAPASPASESKSPEADL